ncbi:restriction endonuclease [Xenococcus sp. PCC 7305]|uniref:restriction endonuclease n=1 Tax=Xenococcus sp. PCC 7305 TaxID=102125 RepID=UPI0002ABBE2B|nr:restriction endonuclease [Xenococcus sp. PCC 7305]ELS03469.1 restriction endonuclease [Xenococcus sp. PCC 7305]
MNSKLSVPSYDYFFEPVIHSLKDLGGSGSIQEIYDRVCELESFSEDQQAILHKDGPQNEISYRLGWARTYLKKYGAIENIGRGVWALTSKGKELQNIDKKTINRFVKKQSSGSDSNTNEYTNTNTVDENKNFLELPQIPVDSEVWIDKLLSVLQRMPPDAFERLCQRILRESGFIKVEVTGKKGDGGIDGIGVLKIALLSFQVFFQCKRYSGSVGASDIRDFRGAMVGRTDKGLFMTTGTFTSGAKKEATRDGAPALDLIDGEQLCSILKDLKLGVDTNTIEVVQIKESWFNGL